MSKFYAVNKGMKRGIYTDYNEIRPFINENNLVFKGFKD